MKLAKVLISFCVFVELCECVDRTIPTRSVSRKRRVHERNERQIRLPPAPLDIVAVTLQEKLDRVEKFNERTVNVLAVLDGKIDKINDKLLSEKINGDETSSINARLIAWENKINELDHKLSTLINQNEKREPLLLTITENDEPSTLENMIGEMKKSLSLIEEKVERGLAQNSAKLEDVKQTIFEQRSNASEPDEFSMQMQRNQRKERRIAGKQNLINEILSVVKKKLKSDDEDDQTELPNNGSLTDMVSGFENMKASAALSPEEKNKASGNSTSRGITFPNVKNKPAKFNTTQMTETFGNKDIRGFSCVELMNAGMRQSGVYYLQNRGTTYWFLKVFCEQEIADGGWTVIQRRGDFGEPRENFNRDWADYKNGFGDPAKEFWIGNEIIFTLTNSEECALRVELEDFEGNKRYAQYSHFKIHSEVDYYKLEIDGYEGNAGDSLNDLTYGSNNSPFSTYNRDNDRSSLNCASMLKGAWWWRSCGRGLNGLYPIDSNDVAAKQGIVWFTWNGWDYALKKSTMMIKPLKSMTL